MTRRVLALASAVLALALAGCGLDSDGDGEQGESLETPEESVQRDRGEPAEVELPARPPGEVAIEGRVTSSLTPLFTEGFSGRAGERGLVINASVTDTDETRGLADLCEGRIDIVDASRPVSAEEVEACEANGLQLVEFQAAFDAIVIATRNERDVGADCLSLTQLREIFVANSSIESWNQIQPFFFPVRLDTAGPPPGTARFAFAFQRILGIPDPTRADLRQDYESLEEEREVKNAVARNPEGVIGILGFRFYGQFEEKLRPLEIDGETGDACVFPSEETIASELYPFSRALRLYTTTAALERAEVREYIRAYLEAATDLATQNDLISLSDPLQRIQLRRIESPALLEDETLVDEDGVIIATRLPQAELPGEADEDDEDSSEEGGGAAGGGRTTTVPAPGTGGTIAEERAPDSPVESP